MDRRAVYKLLLSALFLALFLAALIYYNYFNGLDMYTNSLGGRNDSITSVSTVVHYAFDTIVVAIFLIIASAYLWIKKYKKEAVFIASLGLINGIALFLMKNIIQRARPVNSLIAETGFSFPSGHAATAVVLFGLIIYFVWKHARTVRIWATAVSVLMTLLIGFSRIYLNVHWLSDVLAGYFLGLFLLFLGLYLFERH